MTTIASRCAGLLALGLQAVTTPATALAAPLFTQGGDGSFRNINATGGALPGVNVTGAVVQVNGSSATLASVAQQAANAVPLSLAGQPNGWLQLDANGLVPSASLPASVAAIDQTARSTASAAAAAATAAIPLSLLGKPNGAAALDATGLVPVASLPASVTSPVDATARANAAAAMATATAAVPASLAGKPNGYASLDANGLIAVANLPASVSSPVDATARASASAAQATAISAQGTAAAAVPESLAGMPNGYAALDGNGLVPVANLPAAYTASSAIAAATLGQANGPAKLDSSATLSNNVVTAAWTSAVGRSLGLRATDRLNVKDFGAVGDGVHDDTLAFQTAINLATSARIGYEVEVPSGHYLLTSTLIASISGDSGLHIHGAGSGETMLEWQIPAASSSQDGLDVNAGGISVNTPWGQKGFVPKQFIRLEGLTFMANGYVSHPAGNGLDLAASYASATPSTLPFATITDMAFVGGGQSQPSPTGPNSGHDGWLNGVYLKGVQNVTVTNISVYPPQNQTCSSSAPELGYTSDCRFVAGAGVVLDANPSEYSNQTQGVTVNALNIKGYQAAFAEGGITQGNGLVGGNYFGDRYGAVLGGGVILDQLAGSPVVTTAYGYGGDYGFDVPSIAGLAVGMKIVLSGAVGAVPELATVASIATTTDNSGQYRLTWSAPNDQNAATFSGDSCSFASGSVAVTATCSGTAGAHAITVAALSGPISAGMSIADTTTPSNLPTGESISSISGSTVGYAKTSGQNNYSFGSASSGVTVSFTNGLVLTTPYGSGGFFWNGGACDVYQSCLYAPTDPGSNYGYGGISMHDVGIIGNDASPNEIMIALGSTSGNSFYDINATSGGGGVQQFLVQSGEPVGAQQGSYVYNNQISTQGSTAPQIVLNNAPNSAAYDNSVSGATPLGTDSLSSNFWGLNYANGKVQLGLAGAGVTQAATPFGLASSVVGNLPSSCVAGQIAYAVDGRKPGEAAGAGSGTPVVCTLSGAGGQLQWWGLFGSGPVTH